MASSRCPYPNLAGAPARLGKRHLSVAPVKIGPFENHTSWVSRSPLYIKGLGPQCRQDLNVVFFWDLNVGDLNVGDLNVVAPFNILMAESRPVDECSVFKWCQNGSLNV